MFKRIVLALAFVAGALGAVAPTESSAQAGDKIKPFILAERAAGDQAAKVAEVTDKLTAAGYTVVGTHTPYDGTTLIGITDATLLGAAAKTEFGGYGAVQRVAVVDDGATVQVSYTNPTYMAHAYRMETDLAEVTAKLARVLGDQGGFGPAEGHTPDELADYHYMFGMEYFDDPMELASYDSHEAAIAAVEKGLAETTSGISKVWRVDVPGSEQTVFGVSMVKPLPGLNYQDDEYIMSEIDFKDLKSAAHLPYEILVAGDKVMALHARFRIAINYTDLSMMGSNSFMSIMPTPDAIQKALIMVAGGEVRKRLK